MGDYLETIWRLIIEQLRGIYVSQIEFLFVVGALFVLVPGFVIMKIKGSISKRKLFALYFLFVYTGIMLLITVFRRKPGSRYGIETRLNFGYFGGWYGLKQTAYCVLNVFLFVPFGFLVKIYRWNDKLIKGIVMSTLISFLMSFGIETIQLITKTGTFEVTDLVTNISGGFIGAVIAAIFVFAMNKRKRET